MPKRTDISSILVIGAGPIIIGQASEFDYSGTQACKALKEEGYRVILINSNPATIMTDPDLVDATYIEPITPEFAEKIIALERPDAILPTVGGQTALNCALMLAKQGVLAKYNVKLIGASESAIEKAENRKLFKEAMEKIGLECPKNKIVHSISEAESALSFVGLPAIIRPSFTLGGAGGGIAYTREEFLKIVETGLEASPTNEVLIDESVIGWKEYEMEAIRDSKDNVIIICSIENIDPMGVHTGDSITVAPALTLTDKEYQKMRNATIDVLREIGVDTGGSNVQFAVDPENGRMLVIEMNPRVSRSSALASKATGFPIAKVAAKLAVGYTLDEIKNDCTKVTPASFEPVIDYIVTKIPRFAFEKFEGSDTELSSSMKSVGEAMAIGRSFAESLQKSLSSLEIGVSGLDETKFLNSSIEEIKIQLKKLSPERLFIIADALRVGISKNEITKITNYDPWFIDQISEIIDFEEKIKNVENFDAIFMLEAKKMGFSDKRIAKLRNVKEEKITEIRQNLNVNPIFKRIDTCAGEFNSFTSYLYSTYEGDGINKGDCESNISDKRKIIILGSGPNRIGQGLEFDYTCVHAAYALNEAGFETIMINCNPETVSTDYDTSDRLYFEPLTFEYVYEIIKKEQKKGELVGVIVQFGGQTPLRLANILEQHNVPIIGTKTKAIDIAEDREKFKILVEKLGLKQPKNFICSHIDDLKNKIDFIGYPVVVRPSYVLGGRAMAIINTYSELEDYLNEYGMFFENGPILIDSFLENAAEFDVDAIADNEDIVIAGILEHIEEAGIHSGDSACIIPPKFSSKEIINKIKDATIKLTRALEINGLINIQFAVQNNELYIIEVNPRASRTVPFVAKSTGFPIAKIASLIMAGKKLKDFNLPNDLFSHLKHVSVKEAVFSLVRFSHADTILGPEMRSTGEAMGIDQDFEAAYAKSQLASGDEIPLSGTAFLSVKDNDKPDILIIGRILKDIGFNIVATNGTAAYLADNNVEVERINKVMEGGDHIVSFMKRGKIQLVINTTAGKQSIADSFSIRRTALMSKISYATNISSAKALINAIKWLKSGKELQVNSIQNYLKNI